MGTSQDETSLVDLVKEYLREKYQKPGNVYLGVVSRIDSFVSGVIVFAKTSKAASRLTEQFKSSEVRKKYYAVLESVPRDASGNVRRQGTLQTYLRKNDRLRRVESFDKQVNGSKQAILDFKLVKQNGQFALVDIDLRTGRKHQIRSQFSELGCPVFGDRKYDGKQEFGLQIALHAYSLEVLHPTKKERLHWDCPLPKTWQQNKTFSDLLVGI